MARLINYFELKQRILEERNQITSEFNVHNNAIRCGIRKALRCLEQCQSVTDMVEVVQCKDCRWRKQGKLCYMISGCGVPTGTGDDFFCAYGERRTDG